MMLDGCAARQGAGTGGPGYGKMQCELTRLPGRRRGDWRRWVSKEPTRAGVAHYSLVEIISNRIRRTLIKT